MSGPRPSTSSVEGAPPPQVPAGRPLVVDLIVPARNEAANIAALLDALPAGVLRRVVVVDNGSTDGTGGIAAAAGAAVVREDERGYGAACLAGLRHIAEATPTPDAVAFLDADLADDPAQIPRLIALIRDGAADLAVGTRPALAERGSLTATQRFGNRLAGALIGLSTRHRPRDLGPMRVVRWRALQALDMRDRTWGWMVEMQFKAARRGLRIVEIDVPYRRRRAGKSKISGSVIGSMRAGTKIIATIARLWWHER